MAISVQHLYNESVTVIFYSEEGLELRYDDTGVMDDIAEQACNVLVKHNFVSADVCNAKTGELLMLIERT